MPKKIKTKKLSEKGRLKNEIAELNKEIHSKEADINYWKGRYETLSEKFDDVEERSNRTVSRIEELSNPLFHENKWLKQTLEILIIDPEKMKKLDEIRSEREKNEREMEINRCGRRY